MRTLSMILIFFFLSTTISLYAQKYNSAIGLRFGNTWGLTYQQRILKKTSVELILQKALFKEYTRLCVLGEQHLNLITRRFNLYVGGGPTYTWMKGIDEERYGGLGMTGITGIEIAINRLVISYDISPNLSIIDSQPEFGIDTAISLRYMLSKKKWKLFKKKKDFNWKFWDD